MDVVAKVVTVYRDLRGIFEPVEMGAIRWLKISEALARRGHSVDMAMHETFPRAVEESIADRGLQLRCVPIRDVRWPEYDVVKTLFDLGSTPVHTRLFAHGNMCVTSDGSATPCKGLAAGTINWFWDVGYMRQARQPD